MRRALRSAFVTLVIFVVSYAIVSAIGHWIRPTLPIVPTGENALVLGGMLVMMCVFSAIRAIESK